MTLALWLLSAALAARPATVTVSVVGTNDLHGHIAAEREGRGGLALLGGYLTRLREVRTRDGGGVVLVDAGDMFQGTLESDLEEGAVVVQAMNALAYDGAAIGNHEFDYGPPGPDATARGPGADPRGALKARAAEARFPFLAANLVDQASGKLVAWPNVRAATMVERAGVRVGIVGVATLALPRTTLAANVKGLGMAPLAAAIAREAAQLRATGAAVVIVAAHAGGSCRDLKHPDDLASCDASSEILEVARALPAGLVDVIVAGHVHAAMAQLVGGIAVIESHTAGRAFGRVDLDLDHATMKVMAKRISPPHAVKAGEIYEGAAVRPSAAIARLLAPAVERARTKREELLGVVVEIALSPAFTEESAENNYIADLMRAARPRADVALMNAGGVRAALPRGPLSYGAWYEAMPFDNRFALLKLDAAELRRAVAANLRSGTGILALSGLRAEGACRGGRLVVTLVRQDGRPVADGEKLTVVASDFLATGGDGLFARVPASRMEIEDGPPLRDVLADVLRRRQGTVRGDDKALYDPAAPRLSYDGRRPIQCGAVRKLRPAP